MKSNKYTIAVVSSILILVVIIAGIFIKFYLTEQKHNELAPIINSNVKCTYESYSVSELGIDQIWGLGITTDLFTEDAKMSKDDWTHVEENADKYTFAYVSISIENKYSEEIRTMSIQTDDLNGEFWISNHCMIETFNTVLPNDSITYEFGILYNKEETSVEEIIKNAGLYVNACLEKDDYSPKGWLNFSIVSG